jgi:MoxR-like ATPase
MYRGEFKQIKEEVAKAVVGQEEALDGILRGILSNGHVLVEGVPGIAKTLLIRSLAQTTGCKFSRVQFTVDLLPTDITGITTYTPGKGFSTIKGPVFTNFLIADEINRASPKTQSALLEAMQERQVTIGTKTHKLEGPFFVMANNNPLESSGTYPLPEAQIDRFLFKIKMGYVSRKEEKLILDRNISMRDFKDFGVQKVVNAAKIKKMQEETRNLKASDKLKDYITRIVDATRNPKKYGIKSGRYIEWGGSPRAAIGLYIGAKADAYLMGDKYVGPKNVRNIAKDVLRHRLILNYAGEAEKFDTDKIIDEILNKVSVN